MDSTHRKLLLDKYIKKFEDFTKESGHKQELDTEHQKKVYRKKLETKEDVLKILTEEYLKEYKEQEKWYVDEIFKTKTEVKKLRVKKKRLDTKTKDYEKQVKSLKRDLNKLTNQIEKLDDTITDRKKTSEELDSVIGIKRKEYQKKEVDLKKDIQGDGTDDEYYLNWFRVFIELQQLFDGKKVYIDKLDSYPRYRVRFFGGSGRGGFELTGRIWKDQWEELSNKLDRQPTKEDVLPLILPKIQTDLKEFFKSNKFKTYLRKKTKPIGSGYGKYKRKK